MPHLRRSTHLGTLLRRYGRTWNLRISTKSCTKHSWERGSQICSKEGPHPFPRKLLAEILWQNSKIFFSRTTWQFQLDLAKSIIGWRWLKFVKMKGHFFFRGKVIVKQNHWTIFNQTRCNISLCGGESTFYKLSTNNQQFYSSLKG